MSEQQRGVHYLTITAKEAGQRLDNFLFKTYPSIPKSRIYQMLRKGEVRRNKKRIEASDKLVLGDEIRMPPVRFEEKNRASVPPYWCERIQNAVVFEDERFLVLNKPAGIAVHQGSANPYGVIDVVYALWGEGYAELAHRIDRETSGLLILGKTHESLADIQAQIQAGTVEKKYWCLVRGGWAKMKTVRLNVRKIQAEDGERMMNGEEGKEAITHFKRLSEFKALSTPETMSLLEATIETGRTHQIRLSVQHCGSAIAGDDKYGDREFNKALKRLGYRDMFLHAHTIAFDLNPETRLVLEAPLPQSALQLLDTLIPQS
ncbi:MAG: RluA family pseudouridine synthase [Cardiobacteriaceae bacterium]|nr:RluA family pseudouridine synthase [Cardiobacteriaceae bacterium]